MEITIRETCPEEAEELIEIQKAAFLPLYEKYRDPGNPCLRGIEDILIRLNENYRHFTILADGKTVGAIFYRVHGKWYPDTFLSEGEYYLGRLYIHPDYQGKDIAPKAIKLAETALEVHGGQSKLSTVDDYFFYSYNGVNYLLGYTGDKTELTLPEN